MIGAYESHFLRHESDKMSDYDCLHMHVVDPIVPIASFLCFCCIPHRGTRQLPFSGGLTSLHSFVWIARGHSITRCWLVLHLRWSYTAILPYVSVANCYTPLYCANEALAEF